MGTTIARAKKNAKNQRGLRLRAKKILPALMTGSSLQDSGISESSVEDPRWSQDIITLRKAAEELVRQRQRSTNSRKIDEFKFRETAKSLDHRSPDTRNWAVRALYELDPDRAATLVNNALRDGSQEERRNIGTALADSGLLFEAIDDLMDENHERCYGAFSLLFLVAKAGVVEPLIKVIEKHTNMDLRLAVIRLLASSKEMQVVSALEALSNNNSLSPEIHSAALKAIRDITGQPTNAPRVLCA